MPKRASAQIRGLAPITEDGPAGLAVQSAASVALVSLKRSHLKE